MLPISTPRLLLRRFTQADVLTFLAYRSDPAIARYQGWETCDLAEATMFVQHQEAQQIGVGGEWLQIAIVVRATGLHIGDCALRVDLDDHRQATIGITLASEHQRHGFGAEALSSLLDALFLQLELHRVRADTGPENTGAWKLLERLGLRREGHLLQSLWFKGRWADEYQYAILRDEWLKRSGRGYPQTS